jgi:archaemetzincin
LLKILLQGLGEFEAELIHWLSGELPVHLPFSIIFETSDRNFPIPCSAYNSKRNQFNASQILSEVSALFKHTGFFRILGLLDRDIYVEGLNFIFGLAEKPLNIFSEHPLIALVSTRRLSAGLSEYTSRVFKLRLIKESVHELGHTLSLDHCLNDCVMRFSNTIFEADLKPVSFCNECFSKARTYIESIKNKRIF